MTEFDKEYLNLVKRILKEGIEVENRTGVNTIKIPSHQFHFDLGKEFPILETKQTVFKNAVIEMLWIWQMQSNVIEELHNRGVHIWDEWMVDCDGIYRIYEPYGEYDSNREVVVMDPMSVPLNNLNSEMKPKCDMDGNVMTAKSLIPGKTIKAAKYFGKEYAGTIGTAYGFITNRYGLTQDLIWKAKNARTDRRIVESLWQNEFLRTAVLPSCVWSTEWDITGDKLSLLVHQRSCDTALGLPFNVTQYATFLKMIAQVTGLEAGTIDYSIKDAHIYVNHLDGIYEQLRRERRYNELKEVSELELFNYQKHLSNIMVHLDKDSSKYKELEVDFKICDMLLNPEKPELWLDPSIDDFFLFDNSRELKHCKIKNYKNMGKISFQIAQ